MRILHGFVDDGRVGGIERGAARIGRTHFQRPRGAAPGGPRCSGLRHGDAMRIGYRHGEVRAMPQMLRSGRGASPGCRAGANEFVLNWQMPRHAPRMS
jgi:hypothetical protein